VNSVARFVSPHRNFAHGVRGGVPTHLGPDGVMVPEQTELIAEFTPDLRTDVERDLALSTFVFRGMPIYENGQPVDPTYRISVFDSEIAKLQNGWTDSDEQEVVESLRHNGPIGQMYVEVLPVAADKPWNGYDDLNDTARIVDLALGIDADLSKVVQYERENANRPDVIAALEAAIASADETIIVSA
jgi:hypothetical protein